LEFLLESYKEKTTPSEVLGYKTQQSWRNRSLGSGKHLFPHRRNLYQFSFLSLGVLSCSPVPRNLLVDDGRGLAPQQPGQVVCCLRRRRGLGSQEQQCTSELGWHEVVCLHGTEPSKDFACGDLPTRAWVRAPLRQRRGKPPPELSMTPQGTEASSSSSFSPAAADP